MKTLYVVAFCLLVTIEGIGQKLFESRQSSYYTQIYSITNNQARDLLLNPGSAGLDFFAKPIDFFPSDSTYRGVLPVGHYLFVDAEREKLRYRLESVDNVDVKLLNNHRDLIVVLYDGEGVPVTDAEVSIGNRKIRYKKETGSFRMSKSSKYGLMEIRHEGHISFVKIDRRFNNTWVARRTRGILNFAPIQHLIVSPIRYVRNNIRGLINYGHVYPPGIYNRVKRSFDPPTFNGYMVFNQPKYKPRDTIRVKAFVTRRKGKPITKDAKLVIRSYEMGLNKTLKSPVRVEDGTYHGEFVLSDSMDMVLDKEYQVLLQNKSGNKLQAGSFRYEDYELKQNRYTIRSSEQNEHEADALFLKGTDSNDQPLFDVKAEVLLRPTKVFRSYKNAEFIPDTLWHHFVDLEAIGETRLALPDSIYPAAAFDYEAVVLFRNAENEVVPKSQRLSYDRHPFPVQLELKNDSMIVALMKGVNGATSAEGKIVFFDGFGSPRENFIFLPGVYKVDPNIDRVLIRYNGLAKSFDMADFSGLLDFTASRTKDSLYIQSTNPRKLNFHYFLFRNNVLIDKGVTQTLSIHRRANRNDNYALSVQYVWAGEPNAEEYEIPLEKRDLAVSIHHPDRVYPGQKVEVSVRASDYTGAPAAGADVTAYSVTRKFGTYFVPQVPQWPSRKKGRKVFNEFFNPELEVEGKRLLELAFWQKRLGLDSLTFYRFIFPAGGWFELTERRMDNLTQVAPFVVDSGRLEQIHVIYVDERPVYYSGSETLQPYSFRIDPGEHTIHLRTSDALITIEQFQIHEGSKVVFSVDKTNVPAFVTVESRPTSFTRDEIKKLSRYFMALDSGSGQNFSYLNQDSSYFVVPVDGGARNADNKLLAGPLNSGEMRFAVRDGYQVETHFEPFYSYRFAPELVKMKEFDTELSLRRHLTSNARYHFGDSVLTRASIEKYWGSFTKKRIIGKHPDWSHRKVQNAGRLMISGHIRPDLELTAIFMINLNTPDEYYIFSNARDLMTPFSEGLYQLVIIFNDHRYLRVDSLTIRADGLTCYNLDVLALHDADDFSASVVRMIEKWSTQGNYSTYIRKREMHEMRSIYYEHSSVDYSFWPLVTGRVMDPSDNLPIPGVNVIVKGTTVGTTTDLNGEYRIHCPDGSTLVYSFIGYVTEERYVGNSSIIDVGLTADVTCLSEVVVTALAVQEVRSLTGSVSYVNSIQGKVAGVSIVSPSLSLDAVNTKIRGINSLDISMEPLVVVDGQFARLADIDRLSVLSMEVIDGREAIALYGSRASGGVILISTKKQTSPELLRQTMPRLQNDPEITEGTSIRKNFRDYGFWQPSLRTDKNGIAKFSVTLPDDVTGWNVHALVAGSRKKTGQASSFVQSFKPLMAQIALPHFLVEGDSSSAIGKLTDYQDSVVSVYQKVAVNEMTSEERLIAFNHSHIDTVSLIASGMDSLKLEYSIRHENGYVDGEIRKIPVYRKGITEANGVFLSLHQDTTINLNFDSSRGPAILYAQADLLEVMLDEIQSLKKYPYECNEQTASRLRALLLERQIATLKNEREKSEAADEIRKLIRKLVANQNSNGSWDWWTNGRGGSVWITLHVARVLDDARSAGFHVAIDRESMLNYLTSGLSSAGRQKLETLVYLSEQGERFYEDQFIEEIVGSENTPLRHKLLAQRYRQLSEKEINWGWIDSIMQKTVKGNLYWGADSNHFFNNSVQCTLIAYKILETQDKMDRRLPRIRGFFLEQRGRGWRNTYESALILETILPSLIDTQGENIAPTLRVTTKEGQSDATFPYEQIITSGSSLSVTKSGVSPVYMTLYQEVWNPDPEVTSDGNFEVTTSFQSSDELTAGRAAELKVEVTVKRDAEYVMIEVPIPAGCSYNEKSQSRLNGEVYREYYHNKTNIYCESLKMGTYSYTISLMPRFRGRYTVNPALVECMYFPTIYGRSEMKQINIK